MHYYFEKTLSNIDLSLLINNQDKHADTVYSVANVKIQCDTYNMITTEMSFTRR